MKIIAPIAILLLSVSPAVSQDASQPEIFTFSQRQEQLVEVSSILGRMHQLHQICQPGDYLPDRFRDRMKELVTIEEPPEKTKADMISAFNNSYQSAKRQHLICDGAAQEAMQQAAIKGRVLSGKLASPFVNIEGYDYYKDPEGIEEGTDY